MSEIELDIQKDTALATRDSPPEELIFEHAQYVPRVKAVLAEFGIIDTPDRVVDRLALLGTPNHNGESFLGHSETVGRMAVAFVEGLNAHGEATRISSSTRDLVRRAAFLHDTGKTGPAGPINPNPFPFVKLFNINFPLGTQENHLHTALTYGLHHGLLTTDDVRYITEVLTECGHDVATMRLRDFYNLHSLHTYDILREAGMKEDIAAAASGHHLKRGIKPDHYSARDLVETGMYIEPMDELAAMGRKGNPKREAPMTDRVQAVLGPFQRMSRDQVIAKPYSDAIQKGISTGVITQILEKHPFQIP